MRTLRSKNVENTSAVSDGNKSLSRVTKKKIRSRRTRLSLSNYPIESSDNDNHANKTKTLIIPNEEQVTLVTNIQKSSRKSKRINKVSSEESEDVLENPKTSCVEKHKEQFHFIVENNDVDNKDISTSKKKSSRKTRTSRKNKSNASSLMSESRVNNTVSGEDIVKNTFKCNSTKSCGRPSTSLNADNLNSSKKFSRFSGNRKFSELANQVDDNSSNNLDSENIPEELMKMEASFSGENLNMTYTNNETCIIINDSLDSSKCIIQAKEATVKNTTFDKTSSFEIFNTNIIDKQSLGESTRRDTYEIKNTSGSWSVTDISNGSQNMSVERITLHKKPKSDTNILNTTFDTPSKSTRKKWVKFQSTEVESPILRKSLFNESSKFKKKVHSSTPFMKKITPKKPDQNKSQNNSTLKINSNMKSNTKSTHKAKLMPNFALIHQKANEKQESIKEYSQRKKDRAQKLLSGEKPEQDKDNPKSNVVKSSQTLFGDIQPNKNVTKTPLKSFTSISQSNKNTKEKVIKMKEFISKLRQPISYNKNPKNTSLINKENNIPSTSGNNTKLNKIVTIKPSTVSTKGLITSNKQTIFKPFERPATILNKPNFVFTSTTTQEAKKEEKPVSVFSKGNYMAVANKMKTSEKLGSRDNRRDQLKGVRTNRRFELLMQMRKNS